MTYGTNSILHGTVISSEKCFDFEARVSPSSSETRSTDFWEAELESFVVDTSKFILHTMETTDPLPTVLQTPASPIDIPQMILQAMPSPRHGLWQPSAFMPSLDEQQTASAGWTPSCPQTQGLISQPQTKVWGRGEVA
ncbi:hypothetical protein WJX79_003405 [Trebouxia sp. C0005]